MKASNLLLNSKPVDDSADSLIERLGLINKSTSGHFAFMPFSTKVLRNIERIIHDEMDSVGATEVILPMVQSKTLWDESQRWDVYGQEMFKFQNRKGSDFCLGPTHEEVATDLVRKTVTSAKHLPLTIYQIGTKFRDEKRARAGLLRSKEFLMKDAYSFDLDFDGLNKTYFAMREAYESIFNKLNLPFFIIRADSGQVGGKLSEEFIVISDVGEDKFMKVGDSYLPYDESSGNNLIKGIEIGHIFQLGTRYSSLMGMNFNNSQNELVPIEMGCYGIGVSRLLQTIFELSFYDNKLHLPDSINPFAVSIIPTRPDDLYMVDIANKLYTSFNDESIGVLLDDRNLSFGKKINDSKYLGVKNSLIVGNKIKDGYVDLESLEGVKSSYSIDNIVDVIKTINKR